MRGSPVRVVGVAVGRDRVMPAGGATSRIGPRVYARASPCLRRGPRPGGTRALYARYARWFVGGVPPHPSVHPVATMTAGDPAGATLCHGMRRATAERLFRLPDAQGDPVGALAGRSGHRAHTPGGVGGG